MTIGWDVVFSLKWKNDIKHYTFPLIASSPHGIVYWIYQPASALVVFDVVIAIFNGQIMQKPPLIE